MERAANPFDSGADSAAGRKVVLVQTKLLRQTESRSDGRCENSREKYCGSAETLPSRAHLIAITPLYTMLYDAGTFLYVRKHCIYLQPAEKYARKLEETRLYYIVGLGFIMILKAPNEA